MKSTSYKLNSPPKNKRNKKLIVILLLILIFGLGGGMILYTKQSDQKRAANQQKAQDEAQTKSSKTAVESSDPNSTKNNSVSTATSDEIAESKDFTVQISATDQVNGTVTASAKINNSPDSGTCVFTYTTTDDKPVIQQVSSSNNVCSSSIPEVQFSKLGTWNLAVSFFVNDRKAEATKSVTIN